MSDPLFDRIVVVDWSAASTPTRGRDSIWIAAVDRSEPSDVLLVNPATRHEAADRLDGLLGTGDGPVLLGIDVSLGYPAGFAAAARLGAPPDRPWRAAWKHLAHHLEDRDDNSNNRFAVAAELNARIGRREGPFWGTTSARHVGPHLTRTRPPGTAAERSPAELREVERVLREHGRRPFPVWQLAYTGSVGSQTLTALPVLDSLRERHSPSVRVWPFDTGLVVDPTGGDRRAVVVAEVWPSLLPAEPDLHPVRDAAQVSSLAARLATLDRSGALARWFRPVVRDEVLVEVLAEEGWVLGVSADDLLR